LDYSQKNYRLVQKDWSWIGPEKFFEIGSKKTGTKKIESKKD